MERLWWRKWSFDNISIEFQELPPMFFDNLNVVAKRKVVITIYRIRVNFIPYSKID